MKKEDLLKKVERAEDDKGVRLTPRELLKHFGKDRRTKYNTGLIDRFFAEHQLYTRPNYRGVNLDVEIRLRRRASANGETDGDVLTEHIADYDPVSRIQLLPAANKRPTSIQRDCPVQQATTLMLMHNYSQLPVMNTPESREVDGIISWESIAKTMIHGNDKTTVRDCMNKNCKIIEHTTPLFKAVSDIIENGLVLVRDETRAICGLVTVTDIGEQFVTMSEPFLILEQIENHIRKLIDGQFTVDELKAATNGVDGRDVASINDLSFGEYVRLIENSSNWEKIQLNLDRKIFVQQLNEVREIRNDVMHFHPDGLSEADLETLRKTSAFFETLEKHS